MSNDNNRKITRLQQGIETDHLRELFNEFKDEFKEDLKEFKTDIKDDFKELKNDFHPRIKGCETKLTEFEITMVKMDAKLDLINQRTMNRKPSWSPGRIKAIATAIVMVMGALGYVSFKVERIPQNPSSAPTLTP